jgi:hypothetical protein
VHEPFEPCEELEYVFLPMDPDKYFQIERNLESTKRSELVSFLMNNVDVFTWDLYKVPRVDPKFIQHQLNIDPRSKPIQQRVRRAALVHAETVRQEVEKLLHAGAIQELQYPTWLANTVVVKKKNGKWRVCVNFTNLNKACPKGSFPPPKD